MVVFSRAVEAKAAAEDLDQAEVNGHVITVSYEAGLCYPGGTHTCRSEECPCTALLTYVLLHLRWLDSFWWSWGCEEYRGESALLPVCTRSFVSWGCL